MAAAMAMEVYPPPTWFPFYLITILVGIHPDITLVGSTSTSEFFQDLADFRVITYLLTNIRIQTMTLVPGREFLKTRMRLTPGAAMTPGFFHDFCVFIKVHLIDCAAAVGVGAVVIFVKNKSHPLTPQFPLWCRLPISGEGSCELWIHHSRCAHNPLSHGIPAVLLFVWFRTGGSNHH